MIDTKASMGLEDFLPYAERIQEAYEKVCRFGALASAIIVASEGNAIVGECAKQGLPGARRVPPRLSSYTRLQPSLCPRTPPERGRSMR